MKQSRAGYNAHLGNRTWKIHSAFTYWAPGRRGSFVFLGELENAQSTVQRCLELDPTSVDAHLLLSQISLAQGNFAMCSHCLELGVSHNFQVGSSAPCHRSASQSPASGGPHGPWEKSPGSDPHPSCPSAGAKVGAGPAGSCRPGAHSALLT